MVEKLEFITQQLTFSFIIEEFMTILSMGRDAGGAVTFVLPFSDTGFQTTLAQGVEQHFTVPFNTNSTYKKYSVIFSFDPGLRIYVALNATAEIPGSSFASTVSELNPTSRYVEYGDILSFITPDVAAYVNVKLYAI